MTFEQMILIFTVGGFANAILFIIVYFWIRK